MTSEGTPAVTEGRMLAEFVTPSSPKKEEGNNQSTERIFIVR